RGAGATRLLGAASALVAERRKIGPRNLARLNIVVKGAEAVIAFFWRGGPGLIEGGGQVLETTRFL
ncbi:MAG: hypothetical protein ACI9X4_003065, partial [Glaciecola sp.]